MFDKLEKIDDNLYKIYFSPKDKEVLLLLIKDQGFSLDEDNKFNTDSFQISIEDNHFHLKVTKDKASSEEIEAINKLSLLLIDPTIKNIIDYLIFKNEALTNEKFFGLVKESHLSYESLNKYLPDLTQLGLDFDTNLIEKLSKFEKNFMAIDCQDYIKFIPFDQFNKEKQVNQILAELCELTDKPPVEEWLNTLYRRHLLNKSYESNDIHHILDWMNQLTDFSILKQSLNYDRALAKANQWVIVENQKMGITTLVDEVGVDIQPVSSYKEYNLVKLISKNARKREGYKMTNCIGRVHADSDTIYSVRKNGRRVASLDIRGSLIQEAKGPHNKPIKDDQDKLGTIECLKEMGIDFSNSSHRDLSNIGLRRIRFELGSDSINLVINFLDPLYSSNKDVIRIDSAYNGVNYSEKDSFREKMTQSLPQEIRARANVLLQEIEQNYVVCPITNKMINKENLYSSQCIKKIAKILEQYPNFKQIWNEAVLTFMEADRNRFDLSRDVPKGLGLIMDNYTTVFENYDPKEVRAFFKECVIVYPQFKFHSVLFKAILPTKRTPFEYLADYTMMDSIAAAVSAFAPLTKRRADTLDLEVKFEYEYFKNKTTDEICNFCKNREVYEEQLEKIERYNELAEDAQKGVRSANNAWKEIDSFYGKLIEIYNKLNSLILTNSKINVVDGNIEKLKLSDFKNLKEDLLEVLAEIDEFVNDSQYNSISDEIDTFKSQVSELDSYRNEMDTLSYDANKLDKKIEDCKGCENCDNYEGECEECHGHNSPCSIADIIINNSEVNSASSGGDFLDSVEAVYQSHSYFKKDEIDLNLLDSCLRDLNKINKDQDSFIHSIFIFFQDHTKN